MDSIIARERDVGEGPELLIEGNYEGIRRNDFERGWEGGSLESRREELCGRNYI